MAVIVVCLSSFAFSFVDKLLVLADQILTAVWLVYYIYGALMWPKTCTLKCTQLPPSSGSIARPQMDVFWHRSDLFRFFLSFIFALFTLPFFSFSFS